VRKGGREHRLERRGRSLKLKLGGTPIFLFEGQDFGILPLYCDFHRRLGCLTENRLEMPPHTNMAPHQAKQK